MFPRSLRRVIFISVSYLWLPRNPLRMRSARSVKLSLNIVSWCATRIIARGPRGTVAGASEQANEQSIDTEAREEVKRRKEPDEVVENASVSNRATRIARAVPEKYFPPGRETLRRATSCAMNYASSNGRNVNRTTGNWRVYLRRDLSLGDRESERADVRGDSVTSKCGRWCAHVTNFALRKVRRL